MVGNCVRQDTSANLYREGGGGAIARGSRSRSPGKGIKLASEVCLPLVNLPRSASESAIAREITSPDKGDLHVGARV